ncbi:MAG: helix-hairpin-helix domain-containing protein [Lachnospiraceae bacterium]
MKILLISILVVIAGFCYSCSRGQELVPVTEAFSELPGEPGTEAELQPPGEAVVICYVHICGEVNQPGVYEMEQGLRIYHVVERAGGYTPEAAADYLNLAEPVSDGMKLVVPNLQELAEADAVPYGTGQSGQMEQTTGKININTASKDMLMTLRGIGEARAEDIIRYREEQGKFQSIEDIMNIPGIKNAAFEKIKDDISV